MVLTFDREGQRDKGASCLLGSRVRAVAVAENLCSAHLRVCCARQPGYGFGSCARDQVLCHGPGRVLKCWLPPQGLSMASPGPGAYGAESHGAAAPSELTAHGGHGDDFGGIF